MLCSESVIMSSCSDFSFEILPAEDTGLDENSKVQPRANGKFILS